MHGFLAGGGGSQKLWISGPTEVVLFLPLKDNNPVLLEGGTKTPPLRGNAELSPDLLPPSLMIPRPIQPLLEWGGGPGTGGQVTDSLDPGTSRQVNEV